MEEKKVNYKIMAFNSDGSLIDHYENCEVFVVVEDVKPARVMSEGVYSLFVEGNFEIGDYIIGGCDSNNMIVAMPIKKESYVGRVVHKDINIARVMI